MPLPRALKEQMNSLFWRVLADLHSEDDIHDLLDDLLTPTEKVMLGKRLAIAFLLEKGYDQRTIHSIMKVSVSTVSQVNYWLKNQGKGYRKAISMVRKAEKWQEFWQKLDGLLEDMFSKKTMHQRAYGMRDKEVNPQTKP